MHSIKYSQKLQITSFGLQFKLSIGMADFAPAGKPFQFTTYSNILILF